MTTLLMGAHPAPWPGYRPCDPKIIRDRVSHLELCRRELQALAARRRALLEQSRSLWTCLWELDEAEAWIKEQEQLYSALDFGKDLPGVLQLQRRHAAFEAELRSRGGRLEQALAAGEGLVAVGGPAARGLRERGAAVRALWAQLEELAAFRRRGLSQAQGFFQFQVEAEELAEGLRDARRRAGAEELGQDESRTHVLLRQHQELLEELAAAREQLDALAQQAEGFPPELRAGPEAQSRLAALRELHAEAAAMAERRGRQLQDALNLYTVFGESDACHLWMGAKETWLGQREVPQALEDLDVAQHRCGSGGGGAAIRVVSCHPFSARLSPQVGWAGAGDGHCGYPDCCRQPGSRGPAGQRAPPQPPGPAVPGAAEPEVWCWVTPG